MNGDGYSDVIIGAPYYVDQAGHEGAVFLYYGSPNGLSQTWGWMASGDQPSSGFGDVASGAGDINGDGYGDLIIGAPWHEMGYGEAFEGSAFLYYGSASGPGDNFITIAPDWLDGSSENVYGFGSSVSGAGDVNGDGYADVIIGAPNYFRSGMEYEGFAVLYYGANRWLDTSKYWRVPGNQVNANLGYSVSAAGDTNGDGYSDVIVGVPGYIKATSSTGGAFVYYGNESSGLAVRPRQTRADGATPVAYLGKSDQKNAITLCLDRRAPQGRVKVKMEWEIAPRGNLITSESGVVRDMSTEWRTVNGQPLCESISGLFSATPYHWRIRLRYAPFTAPLQPAGRWITIPSGGWNETRLRTGGILRFLFLPSISR